MPYTSRIAEYRADLAELIALYRTAGIQATSDRCSAIADARRLADNERLTLADGFRRAVILGLAD